MVTAFVKANGLSVMNCRGALHGSREVQIEGLSELQVTQKTQKSY